MAKKIKNSSTQSRVKLIAEVKFPEPGVWDILIRGLNLNATQTNKLEKTIRDIVLDIEEYRSIKAKNPARSDLTARLKLMEKALSKLQREVDRSLHLMGDFLPQDTMERIGRSFTFSTIGDALGRDVFPQSLDVFIGRTLADKKQITMEALERRSRPQRDALGLTDGHKILKHFIGAIHSPLAKWVKLDRLNKGGRPPQVARTCLIYRLAEAAPDIIGKRASVSTTGPFARLCLRVLPACGLSEKGAEKAIPAIVREVRADQTEQAKRNGGSS